uniref:CARD domain-containing protein n=1 Tax=Malurus cyaneus samueli TaxID=2593467 RepID=A0A8C5X7Y2_9PASS
PLCLAGDPEIPAVLPEQEEEEDTIWEKIESARHQLTRSLNPAKLTPYLRQCRVIDEQDEEEVLNSCRFPCKSNQTGYLMDILRRRGKRGYEAFLESLEFYYPEHYTRLTGREPAQRCSMILGRGRGSVLPLATVGMGRHCEPFIPHSFLGSSPTVFLACPWASGRSREVNHL